MPELAGSEIPNQGNLTSLAMFFQTFSNVPFYATNIRMIILVMVAIIGDDDD